MNDIELITQEFQSQLDGTVRVTEEQIQNIIANDELNRTEEKIRARFKLGSKMLFAMVRKKTNDTDFKNATIEVVTTYDTELESFIEGLEHEPCVGEMGKAYVPRFKEL
jgi:hypothetical protein|tara:strand:+ start:269 stop:595 length:327 start_codon:yes stop_codon:yes gene_type:complete